uniref:Glycosyl transferase family 1 domain-containing protein n=1 Tax=viral metagenome TaxID=1070528 RepID=A0A6C0DJ48_9ZZZZ
MSRELIGFAVLALACILISPFYKSPTVNIIYQPTHVIHEQRLSVKSNNTKNIVLLSDSFLPTTFAGSELSAFETIRYLRARGHTITIFVKEWEVPEYDGFEIYKYELNDEACKQAIINCDIVFFQMGDDPKNLEIVKHRTEPVFVFIHLVDRYPWLLQQKMSFPISVVYNSHMTQDTLPTLHDNMRMIPYVETDKFKGIRLNTIQNDVVCLINCNHNKGGELFKKLAHEMPNVQFLGVKGGYSNQVIDNKPPPNLTYIENQEDIMVVFKKIGILVMPSKNETWGRTAVEAMSAGVPVIHSEAPGLVECVGGAGIMCSHDDKDAWANAIRRLISDRAYRERIRQYGFKRVDEIKVEQIRGRQELAIKVESN